MKLNLATIRAHITGRIEIPAEHADYIRGMQMHTFRSLLPFGLIASSANAAILIVYFAFRSPSAGLWVWTGIMVCMALLGVRASLHASRDQQAPRPRPARSMRRSINESAMLGTAWAICPILLIPISQGFDLAIVLWISSGMVTGAAYMLSTLPRAAIPFVATLVLGMAIGVLRSGVGAPQLASLVVLAGFTVVMIRSMFWNYSNYVRSWLQQAKLAEQADQLARKTDVISLLLNEFEQAASDTLWEADARHRLIRPSEVLAERTNISVEDLDRQHLAAFFDATNMEGRDEMERLHDALRVNGEIHNICLPVRRTDRTEWWRMSAKPTFGDDGRFEGYRGVASDITDKYLAQKQVYHLAHFDALTSVPKRDMLLKAINTAVSETKGTTSRFAVLAVDIDRFKTINDVFGHTVGDAYLIEVADRLRDIIGPDDVVSRFGGDEFVILQRDVTGRNDAMELAAAIRTALAEPVEIDGTQAQSSVSIGVSIFPDHAALPVDLLKYADQALLASKAAGRDTVRVFESNMNDDASERIALETDLRNALAGNELSLNFQPIVHAKSGRFGSFEALIRWHHPTRGSVGPDIFVPILEQAGMITTVGDWIIREALREAATWDETTRISINLSPLQVRNRSLVATVAHALAQTGVDPKRVEFEITETALFDDTEESLSTLHGLHSLGVSISLDDFGTGFSSLSLLRIFPFDKIKIDKSFIDRMETSEECLAIVRAVIGLASSLGMRTTAEGIETASQAERLKKEGCSELQGFYFGRPQLPGDLVKEGLLRKAAATATRQDDVAASAPGRQPGAARMKRVV
ncbi:putative bifunctional diguanylate cyclase/phosphodiesterase [Hyphomonas johnsonii]|uniref:PAS/PAC sensor-containing diguanylate cyclase/phosphodiesterase n=1 Tax=Hyphomonas johnsonii MHS-2 TaxID=1280950 RepID=A0A059FNW0_9PROT|nr:EAL domain-containing protein [Hyphomonas johnsonii]KCZ92329.1 PAS/PAC sensor-containing diguanylate cyclase/phosphodiesterase [Hyphomonas johnsonii MHS-2]